jgi:hypothetical protein
LAYPVKIRADSAREIDDLGVTWACVQAELMEILQIRCFRIPAPKPPAQASGSNGAVNGNGHKAH